MTSMDIILILSSEVIRIQGCFYDIETLQIRFFNKYDSIYFCNKMGGFVNYKTFPNELLSIIHLQQNTHRLITHSKCIFFDSVDFISIHWETLFDTDEYV